ETFDYRIAVEGAAARLAADRRTDDDLAILQDAYEVMRSDRETRRFRAADNAFHLAIADAARNRLVRQAIQDAPAAMGGPVRPANHPVVPDGEPPPRADSRRHGRPGS